MKTVVWIIFTGNDGPIAFSTKREALEFKRESMRSFLEGPFKFVLSSEVPHE
jgi:hypothetical protein